jgi:hypothetical protein
MNVFVLEKNYESERALRSHYLASTFPQKCVSERSVW